MCGTETLKQCWSFIIFIESIKRYLEITKVWGAWEWRNETIVKEGN